MALSLSQAVNRSFHRIPLQRDKYDVKFAVAVGVVLVFSVVSFWSLTEYGDVQWYAGEDGVSEWWTVAAYVASATMAGVVARTLMRLGHLRLGWLHALFAVLFVIGALEEISWGQRIFDWSTPGSLASINEQGETTVHNLWSMDRVAPTAIFWGSALALLGAIVRAILHHQGRVTNADFILPSLVLSPALLMIMFWIGAGQSVPGNLPRMLLIHFDLRPVGSEIPEVLVGLCLLCYYFGNLKRAFALRSRAIREDARRTG